MNTKTFKAIEKLKEVELELHRLKNALEMANTALDPQRTWVGLTEAQCGVLWKTNMTPFEYYQAIEAKLKENNNG